MKLFRKADTTKLNVINIDEVPQYKTLKEAHDTLKGYCDEARKQNELQRLQLIEQDKHIENLDAIISEQDETIAKLEAEVQQADQKRKLSIGTGIDDIHPASSRTQDPECRTTAQQETPTGVEVQARTACFLLLCAMKIMGDILLSS